MRTQIAIIALLAVALNAAVGSAAPPRNGCWSEYLTDDIPYKWEIRCLNFW